LGRITFDVAAPINNQTLALLIRPNACSLVAHAFRERLALKLLASSLPTWHFTASIFFHCASGWWLMAALDEGVGVDYARELRSHERSSAPRDELRS
jgi:hypothetical protein